jgi:hypothetical protein
MSTRGTDFLHKWVTNNLTDLASMDVISLAETIQKLFADAKAIGISSNELEEDTGSIYQAMFEAITHQEGGNPD